MIRDAAEQTGRKVLQSHFTTQPFDFAANSQEKAYLKALWLRLE
jgi:23S rRNA G2069 N7-methylase RlmK/C1962 C5-methylase RlmI